MKFALAQINPTIGDIAGNAQIVRENLKIARDLGAEVAVFPEQTLLGYPAKDFLLRHEMINKNVDTLHELAADCLDIAAIVGFAEPNPRATGRPVSNSAAFLHAGSLQAIWRKQLLPTYDVFDEARYFEPAGPQTPFEFRGVRLGVTICEDMLSEHLFGRALYSSDPVADAAAGGADVLINISASPYFLGKHEWRIAHMGAHARRNKRPVLFVNQLGGNDELLFDGCNCVFDREGKVVGQAKAFGNDLLIVDLDNLQATRRETVPVDMASLHEALVLGLRDYARKCGFRCAVLGLSGGIDSAVVACLAARAFGADRVHGVAMPSRFSSAHSVADAKTLAENLGIRFSIIPIEPMHAAFETALKPLFEGHPAGVAEENIQARTRGVILMGLSNKFGGLLLTTGNKSELATGYCTLYGDMCGGLAVISDVPKMMVYDLAGYINSTGGRSLIPESTLTKPPSAELRPNQTDQDSLPPYPVLDAIVERYEEQLQSREEIAAAGFERDVVNRMVRLMHLSEYKRQQAAPGLKVTSRAFGFGRRMPIAAKISE